MKISGAIIQNRFIYQHDDTTFHARYKGCEVWVSSDHGLGEPEYDHLTRWNIEVTCDGSYLANTWEDCPTMENAIRLALEGACLI